MTGKIDPFNVEALERSVNDSAVLVSAIWVSFLIFSLYLVVAASAITHRQLFLEEPVKLPALNIDLPLWGFFFLAPILFVIFHAYVLLQVVMLGRTAAAYNTAVDRAVKAPTGNAWMRQRLANTLFAQIFAGSPREREGVLGHLLKLSAWVTLAVAPVLVLLVFQFRFLPYHSHLVTWMHRSLILAELTTILLLWPLVLDARSDVDWQRTIRRPTALISLALFAFGSVAVLTFPGEPHVNLFTGRSVGSIDCERGWREIDRLNLTHQRLIDYTKLSRADQEAVSRKLDPAEGESTLTLAKRNLTCGLFDFVDIRRADLSEANAVGAHFKSAALQGAMLRDARLGGALLDEAQLDSAYLDGAHLQHASLARARLRGASLREVKLQGAKLDDAHLQGASLDRAHMQGASLHDAQLQGADLSYARLDAASLTRAQLEGVQLFEASLQGAWLPEADLRGASLNHTDLQVADLDGAQLQGSDLRSAKFDLASLSGVYVWRAKITECVASATSSHTFNPHTDLVFGVRKNALERITVAATPQDVEQFIERTLAVLPDRSKKEVGERMREGLVADPKNDDTATIAVAWQGCAVPLGRSVDEYFRARVDYLVRLVCEDPGDDDPFVAKGIADNWIQRRPLGREYSRLLAVSILDQKCAVSRLLDEHTRFTLEGFVPK
jgi:uncharacterized protein YjbI with pentapeptide repeats